MSDPLPVQERARRYLAQLPPHVQARPGGRLFAELLDAYLATLPVVESAKAVVAHPDWAAANDDQTILALALDALDARHALLRSHPP